MNTIVSHELIPPIKARFIRLQPLVWHGHITMRVELYGCTQGIKSVLYFRHITFSYLYITYHKYSQILENAPPEI